MDDYEWDFDGIDYAYEPDDFETYNQNEADDYRHELDDFADYCEDCGEFLGVMYPSLYCAKCRKVSRCPDCGERGESRGHMECQYPSDD